MFGPAKGEGEGARVWQWRSDQVVCEGRKKSERACDV